MQGQNQTSHFDLAEVTQRASFPQETRLIRIVLSRFRTATRSKSLMSYLVCRPVRVLHRRREVTRATLQNTWLTDKKKEKQLDNYMKT